MGHRRRSGAVLLISCLFCALLPAGAAMAAPSCAGKRATIVGTQGADHLQGTAAADVIVSLGGRDRIEGGRGDDLICSGAGADTVEGGIGDDRIDGGDGSDYLRGEGGADLISGRGGNDRVFGEQGRDRLAGGGGRDYLTGTAGRDIIKGGAGADFATGGNGSDELVGGAGDDSLVGDQGDDELSGAAGDDVLVPGRGDDVASGGEDDDVIESTFVSPTRKEPAADDGDDRFDGGGGMDTISYASSYAAVDVSLAEGRARGDGIDRLRNLEAIVGSRHSDALLGNGADNRLAGGEGDDTIDGGAGTDQVDYRATSRRLVINLAGRAATGQGEDSLVNIENVFGGSGSDFMIGDSGPNELHGGRSGSDIIRGLDGSDSLIGGLSDVDRFGQPIYLDGDNFSGGAGNDLLDGAFGDDTADFTSAVTGVTVDLVSGTATGEGADRLVSIEDVNGSGYDDNLVGDEGANALAGRAGDDVLTGAGGDDTLVGGSGDDVYDGGEGRDEIDFATSRAAITADLSGGTISGEGTDTVTGVEDLLGSTKPDTFIGDDGENYLVGRTGHDTLDGGEGDDIILGLKGDDAIRGAGGNDMLYDGDHNDTVEGGAGHDYLRTGIGDDHFDGGEGMDTLELVDADRGMRVDLVAGTTSTFGTQGTDTVANVENLLGTVFTDEFSGGTEANYFIGYRGVDEFLGGGGDDLLEPLSAADIVDGEEGEDTLVYAAGDRPVTVDLSSGFGSGHGNDTLLGLEGLIGSPWPDIFRGSDAPNVFLGGGGGDILEGVAGDDHLDGEDGFDTLDGGADTDACLHGESLVNCEGEAAGPGGAQAQNMTERFLAFRALIRHWYDVEVAMRDEPTFQFLPRPLLRDMAL